MSSYANQVERLRSGVEAIESTHSEARSLTDFARYENDPHGFMRDVLGFRPWEMQVTISEMVRDSQRVCAVSANGMGKDAVTARIALWWVYARRGMCILTGPTERQVKQILMREVRRAFNAAPDLPGDLYATELRVSEDAGILAFTSDNADRLVGFHHPRLLVAITEGQGVEDVAYEAAQACCTDPNNRLFVYGNPMRPTGAFYRAANSGSWNTLHMPASAHPNVISGRNEIPGGISRQWVDDIRNEYGETSAFFRSRVLAEFPEDSAEGLISRAALRAAFDRFESGAMENAASNYRPMLSLDVARFGPDASVLSVIQGPIVREIVTWRGATITDSADRAEEHIKKHWTDRRTYPPAIAIDEVGLGAGCVDILRRKGYSVFAFNGAAKPADPRFLNARAESHWSFRELLENNRIAIPRDLLLEEEALAIEWQPAVATNKIQIVSKDTVRGSIGRSPDRLDSIVIGYSYGIGRSSFNQSIVTTYRV